MIWSLQTFLKAFGLIGLLLVIKSGFSQASFLPNTTRNTLFDYFTEAPDLEIILTYDIDSVIYHKTDEKPFKGQLIARSNQRDIFITDLKISARGNFRKKECDFPPLKLDFQKDELDKWGLAKKFDKYKLVTQCLDDKLGQHLLHKEFLVYQMLNTLTDHSYRAIQFPITYRDPNGQETIRSTAFLIEGSKDLEGRLGAQICDCKGPSPDTLEAFQTELIALFQYMIGNRDIDLNTGHNVDLLATAGTLSPIIYDFDYSYLVQAPYAFPDPEEPFNRVYLGYEKNADVMPRVLKHYLSKKEALFAIVEEYKNLPRAERISVLDCLRDFFVQIEDANYRIPYIR